MDWRPDVLGGFEQLPLALPDDEEGAVGATLVRPTAAKAASWGREPHGFAHGIDVLYLHGWSDYFFQAEHALFWTRAGARFHALDLRKYGRSLLPHQTPGYTDDLAVYDAAHHEVGLSHVAGERAAGKDFQLWMIEGKNAPVSMGVIPTGPTVHIELTPALQQKLAQGAVLAISVEPAGGSPTGQPTGPVVATGDLKSI